MGTRDSEHAIGRARIPGNKLLAIFIPERSISAPVVGFIRIGLVTFTRRKSQRNDTSSSTLPDSRPSKSRRRFTGYRPRKCLRIGARRHRRDLFTRSKGVALSPI